MLIINHIQVIIKIMVYIAQAVLQLAIYIPYKLQIQGQELIVKIVIYFFVVMYIGLIFILLHANLI
jgi:hypothetical protein